MESDNETTGENRQMLTSIKEPKDLNSLSTLLIPLPSRYSDEQWRFVHAALESVCLTRKTRKISGSVRLKILKALEKFSTETAVRACQIYVSKCCATEGKNERYLIGIARGLVKQEEANKPQPVKTIDPAKEWADGVRVYSRDDMERWRAELVQAYDERRPTNPQKESRVNRCMHDRPGWDWR